MGGCRGCQGRSRVVGDRLGGVGVLRGDTPSTRRAGPLRPPGGSSPRSIPARCRCRSSPGTGRGPEGGTPRVGPPGAWAWSFLGLQLRTAEPNLPRISPSRSGATSFSFFFKKTCQPHTGSYGCLMQERTSCARLSPVASAASPQALRET